jgi:glycosyltransferase involved in cell wall biosynthesis
VSGEGGGPEKTILNSPRFLKNLGYRGLCAYMHPPDDPGFEVLTKRAAEAGAPLLSVPDRGLRDMSVFRQLLSICKQENVSIWHGHDYKSNFIGLMLRRFHPMRLVTTVHGWVKYTKKTPLYYWIDKQCLKRYDRVICVSDDLHATCLKAGVAVDRCQVIHNAIDTAVFRRTLGSTEAKAKTGLPTTGVLIGAAGRLSEEKGFDTLIRAVSRLNAGHQDIHLAIAGEGDARPELEKLIHTQSHPERFHLLGHRNDIQELFQAMDVFALSSLREGLPNVLLEAMALEVPVVATRIAGIPKLIQHEQNGFLVEAGDENSLTRTLQELIDSAEVRGRFGRCGQQTVEKHFSFERRMRKVVTVYDDLCLDI